MRKITSLISLIILIASCIGLMSGCSKSTSNSSYNNQSSNSIEVVYSPEPTATIEPTPVINEDGSDKIKYFLLLGKDNQYASSIDVLGNSDGIVIVALNMTDKTIALTSILRDTVFPVADHPYETNKATLIYHYYGEECLIKSLEESLGIKFDNYLAFNYYDIIDLVDMVGGIDTEVYPDEIKVANGKLRGLNRDLLGVDEDDGLFTEDSGVVHMTGKQAAVFMRVRLSDETNNDFGRTERERRVILLLKDKFLELNPVKQISFVKTVLGMIDTNLSVMDAVNYAKQIDEFRSYAIKSDHIPQDDTYYGSNGYIHMNLAENLIFFFNQVYGDNGGMPIDLQEKLAQLKTDLDNGNEAQYYN